ncbi:class I SAM-dependent methyltransferase [Conexibacter arvalis]|uniref:class I SAM-dependent methyltransferase n=1 Tax=Conexibacter arvalis TaxID=912552 RepID=UPI001607D792|nr:class I SAM-dependent methyltransferase [Conexibacter arvalis]
MPTIPPSTPSPTPRAPHRARRLAESFGADPERYDRTRPRYPQQLVDRIVASAPGPDVLDVGIGTGVAARPFKAAGCRVLGVEVDARMAAFARAEGFDVEVAKFEEWHPAGRTFDAIIAGQTWHWIDPAAGAAKAAELLQPGGLLAVFWNVQQAPPELAQAFSDVYRRVLPNTPFAVGPRNPLDAYDHILGPTTEGIRATGAFGKHEQWRFDWTQPYAKDEWLDQVPTFGGHSRLPQSKLAELLTGIGDAIDAAGGSFTMGYATIAIVATVGDHRRTDRPDPAS